MMCDDTGGGDTSVFSAEQEGHFQRRYDEGYNLLIDRDYVRWLKVNHPESQLLTVMDYDELDAQTGNLRSDVLGVLVIYPLFKNYSCLLGSTVNSSNSSSLDHDEQDVQTEEESGNLRSSVSGVLTH